MFSADGMHSSTLWAQPGRAPNAATRPIATSTRFIHPSLEIDLQCELHAAVVDNGRRDAACIRVANRAVWKAEAGMVEQVEHIPPELDVRTSSQFYAFRQRGIEVHVSGAVEDAAARVSVRVRGRRDEVSRVEPEVDGRVVELAGPDPSGPA